MKFKVGDRIRIVNDSQLPKFYNLLGKVGVVIKTYSPIIDIVDLYEIEFDNSFKDLCGGIRNSYGLYENEIDFLDEEREEERKKLKELSRLEHIEIDPFGEENW